MRMKAIKAEAERLMRDFGSGALNAAADAVTQARRQRNVRLQRFFETVYEETLRQERLSKTSVEKASDPRSDAQSVYG